jgi:hypothetical protein
MRFDDAYIPLPLLWRSPLIRWQGPAADLSALDVTLQITPDALQSAEFGVGELGQLIFGTTI